MTTTGLLSVHEAAIRLSAAEHTIRDWAAAGVLPATIVAGEPWFHPADIAAYAAAHPDPDPPGDGQVNDLVRPLDPLDPLDPPR